MKQIVIAILAILALGVNANAQNATTYNVSGQLTLAPAAGQQSQATAPQTPTAPTTAQIASAPLPAVPTLTLKVEGKGSAVQKIREALAKAKCNSDAGAVFAVADRNNIRLDQPIPNGKELVVPVCDKLTYSDSQRFAGETIASLDATVKKQASVIATRTRERDEAIDERDTALEDVRRGNKYNLDLRNENDRVAGLLGGARKTIDGLKKDLKEMTGLRDQAIGERDEATYIAMALLVLASVLMVILWVRMRTDRPRPVQPRADEPAPEAGRLGLGITGERRTPPPADAGPDFSGLDNLDIEPNAAPAPARVPGPAPVNRMPHVEGV